MKIAIIYKSVTGNTKLLAEEIQKNLNNEVIYIGAPQEDIDADLYFIGSWTFKGECVKEIADYLKTIHNKKIAYFGTCGFGGSISYYETIFKRVESNIDESNELLGYFICQGKMPLTVKQKYIEMIKVNPEDKNLQVSIKNFDEALNHPDESDLRELKKWLESIIQ